MSIVAPIAIGAAVAARLDIPHHDTDDFYWEPTDPPYRTARPVAERLALLEPRLRDAAGRVVRELRQSTCSEGGERLASPGSG
mgnify:CR=1 FL=1